MKYLERIWNTKNRYHGQILIVTIIGLCLSCGGGGSSNDPPAYDPSGAWEVTFSNEVKVDGNYQECGGEAHDSPYNITIQQIGTAVSIKDNYGHVADGEVDGNKYHFSYRRPDRSFDEDYVDVEINFTMNSPVNCSGSYTYNEVDVFPGEATFFCTVEGDLTGVLAEAREIDPENNNAPTATISFPQVGSTFKEGEEIRFEGNWRDTEDINIPEASIVWVSDIDGMICSGESCASNELSAGVHQVTLSVTDFDGAEGTATLTIPINASSTIISGVLPDTGQTISNTDVFGEDSDYTINPPHYTKLDKFGAELSPSAEDWVMVRDDVTGLVWEVKTDSGGTHDNYGYTWQDAQDVYLAQLNDDNFGGYSDWRLPTILELSTIVYPNTYRPAANRAYFPNTGTGGYWASTEYAGYFEAAYYLDFYSGTVSVAGEANYQGETPIKGVRAVRGTPNPPYLVDNSDYTVSDTVTLLTWQQLGRVIEDWEVALNYCEELEMAGSSDWRLPNRSELLSIVSFHDFNPAIDSQLFPNTVPSEYWTSTSVYGGRRVWTVNFYSGSVRSDFGDRHNNVSVRCVRGGQ